MVHFFDNYIKYNVQQQFYKHHYQAVFLQIFINQNQKYKMRIINRRAELPHGKKYFSKTESFKLIAIKKKK